VRVEAVYASGGQCGVTAQTTVVLSVYATLAAAFNDTLAAAGLATGAVIKHDGITFTWPDVPAGEPDNVVAQGQTILLSGSGTTLGFLGAGSPGNESGSGTVYYTDGSTSTFSITLDNYFDARRWPTTSSPPCRTSTTPTRPPPGTAAGPGSGIRPGTSSTRRPRSRRARPSRR